MRFTLIDRILDFESGSHLRAIKSPSLAEDYLQDHFPNFPVMPGVLMLESMYQAAAWLLRITDDFEYSMALLKEAKNVKYSGFVKPGQLLEIQVNLRERAGNEAHFKAQGLVEGKVVVAAKLILHQFNLADEDPSADVVDQGIITRLKCEFETLRPALGIDVVSS